MSNEFCRQGLTENEVKNILLLMEGDLSDLDMEDSDDDIDLPNFENDQNGPDSVINENSLSYEVLESNQNDAASANDDMHNSDFDSEDEIPLSMLQKT